MAVTSLKYGSYTHPLMPRVVIKSEQLADETGAIVGRTETWEISGTLIGTSQSDLVARVEQLEAAYAAGGHDLAILASNGSTVLRQLDSSASISGTHPRVITYPGGDAPELASRRDYFLIVTAGFLNAALDTYDARETASYTLEQNGKTTRKITGSLKTSQGVNASSKYAENDPGTPSGYIRIRETKSVNAADSELTYEFLDRECFKPLPSGVLDGASNRSESVDSDGRKKVAVAGSFIGSGAMAGALAQKLVGSAVVSETITSNEYTGEVAFRYEYEETSGDNLLELSETIEVASSFERRVVRHTVGGSPVVQTVGASPARAVQAGCAVGKNTYPSFQPMVFAASNLAAAPVQRRVSPRDVSGTRTDWRIEWRYEFVFESTPLFPMPGMK